MHPRLALTLLAAAVAVWGADELTVGGDFRGALHRFLTHQAEQAWSERAGRMARLASPAEVARRRAFVRQWLLDSIGGFPPKTPLNARITGRLERDGYRIEKIIFESQPRFYVTANLYLPAGAVRRLPAVLGVAGHSDVGKAAEAYQSAWIGFVRRGFAVFAIDPPGQGERIEYLNLSTGKSALGPGVPEHIASGLQCLLTGSHMARYMIWDGIRAIDYLLTRPEIDPNRIAVAGNSGGGTQAAYLAVVEPRLAAAVTSCYITSWETLWHGPGPQDAEQVFVNFLRDGLDFGDFLIAFAPKPIQMTTATRDFFPIVGARATFAEVERIFAAADAPARAGYFEYDDEHGWTKPRREAAYRWLARWLQNREEETPEAPAAVEPPEVLRATPSGQVATSFSGAATVRSLNRDEAARLYPIRAAARMDAAAIRDRIRERLHVIPASGTVPAVKAGEIVRPGYRIEKLALTSPDGIAFPALLFQPERRNRKAVLWLDSAGKAAAQGEIEKLVLAGETVLAIDPRGTGESASPAGTRGYTPEYQTAMRALLVGRPLLGMQVTDALAAVRYLQSRKDVAAASIRAVGRGNAGVTVLLAAAMEQAISSATVEGSPVSWMDIVRADVHTDVVPLIAGSVLRDFDLSDAAACVAPRELTLRALRKAGGAPASEDLVRQEYGRALEAYRGAGAADKLRILSR